MVDPIVRRLQAYEVRQMRELRLAALAQDPEAFLRSHDEEAAEPDAFWQRRARNAAASAWVATFVAVAGERHLGTATGLWNDRRGPAELVGMWVHPECRRRGLGGSLVEAVCEWAAQSGAECIELEVRTGNAPARRLYERCGFAETDLLPILRGCDRRMRRVLASRDRASPHRP